MAKSAAERQQQKNDYINAKTAAASNVSPIPKVKNRRRRNACGKSFRLFCETYFAEVFTLAWSDDHLRVIAIMEDVVLRGGSAAIAMPRGSGKSSLCVAAAMWAILYGYRRFVVIIGASADAAINLIDGMKIDFENNQKLNEDFPEVCHPIRRLDGKVQRAIGQHCDGVRTRIGWTGEAITLPTIKGSKSSGATVRVAGITGRIRGMQSTLPSGEKLRPDLAIIDDPQTDESAASRQQVAKRLRSITGAVMGMAGPKKKIASFAAVTVIEPKDVADQLLDRDKNPQWQGQRCKLLHGEPKNTRLWEEYAEHRSKGLKDGSGLKYATEFYRAHQIEMDEGMKASWPARFNTDEASAIQYAIELKLASEEAFAAEYQNEPISVTRSDFTQLTQAQLAAKVIGLKCGIVPSSATTLTAMIDVQQDVLFWLVVAWSAGFTGHVVDYGTWPEQSRLYFGLRDLTSTIRQQPSVAGQDYDAQLYHALNTCSDQLLTKQWATESGGNLQVTRLLVDDNWGPSTQLVRLFVKQSQHRKQIICSQGVGVTAKKTQFADFKKEDGVRAGLSWRWNTGRNHIRFDSNWWKSFVYDRIRSPRGSKSTMTFCAGSEVQHRLLFEHLCTERARQVTDGATGRTKAEWESPPHMDNHWWDALIGSAVGASVEGMQTDTFEQKNQKRKRGTLRIA